MGMWKSVVSGCAKRHPRPDLQLAFCVYRLRLQKIADFFIGTTQSIMCGLNQYRQLFTHRLHGSIACSQPLLKEAEAVSDVSRRPEKKRKFL
jgi:hypothetical protein